MANSPQKLENVSQTTLNSGYPRDGEECPSRSVSVEFKFETPVEAVGTSHCSASNGVHQPLSSQQDTKGVMPSVSATPATEFKSIHRSQSQPAFPVVESNSLKLADVDPKFDDKLKRTHTITPEVSVNTQALEMEKTSCSTSQMHMVRPTYTTQASVGPFTEIVTPKIREAEILYDEDDIDSSQHSYRQKSQNSPQSSTTKICTVEKDFTEELALKSVAETLHENPLMIVEEIVTECDSSSNSLIMQPSDQADPQKDQYVKILQKLKNSEMTVCVQYQQLCFIGPPRVGKTTTCNQLLRLPISSTESQHATVAKYNQVLALIKRDKWQSSKDSEKSQLVLGPLIKSVIPLTKDCMNTIVTRAEALSNLSGKMPHSEVPPVQESAQISSSKLQTVLSHLKDMIRTGDYLQFTNLLDSTFLNVHDIAGQPGFLEMLPALIHGPAMYLVCFNMNDDFDNQSTTKAMIFRILTSIASTDFHKIENKPFSLEIESIPEFSEKFEEFKKIRPTIALIGTHTNMSKDKYNDKINKSLTQMIKVFGDSSLTFIGNYHNKTFFPFSILNSVSEDITLIRRFIANYFVTQFEHVALPIQPKWLLFGIALRRDYHIIKVSDCLEIGEELKMSEVEVKVCLWYLHYCVGTIIYFPDLPDKWFKENVICSPQVVFNSIEQLILHILRSGRLVFWKDKNNWTSKGQFSVDSLLNCYKREYPNLLEDKRLIPIENLVNLLKYINLLSFVKSTDQVMCFMPAILEYAPQEDLINPPPPDEDNPEPLFIRFKCGYVPTGVFCGLITHLVSLSMTNIFGMEWQLKQDGVRQNRVSFYIHDVNEVTFLSHNRCFEIRLNRKMKSITLHDLCTHVLSVVMYVLGSLYKDISPIIAFQCRCVTHKSLYESQPSEKRYHWENLCTFKWGTICAQYLCANCPAPLSNSQQVWIGKEVTPGDKATLEILKYANHDLSFNWIKDKATDFFKLPVTENGDLLFTVVEEKHFCHYQCQAIKDGKVVFTTYRALFRSNTESSNSGRDLHPQTKSSQLVDFCKRKNLHYDNLDNEVSDDQIHNIYPLLEKWVQVAYRLGLKGHDIEAIEQKAVKDVKLMRLYTLQEWKNMGKINGTATYRVLLKALLHCNCISDEMIEVLEKALNDS